MLTNCSPRFGTSTMTLGRVNPPASLFADTLGGAFDSGHSALRRLYWGWSSAQTRETETPAASRFSGAAALKLLKDHS
jgi:hypothetical protein